VTDRLSLSVPPELVEAIADQVEATLRQRGAIAPADEDRWLNVESAAAHIDCKVSRIYALTSAGRIPHHHDGSRLVFRRSELDAWIRRGGGVRP
jgi:excisionase family DNA binding protein